jgi:hypothetical protein
VIAVWAKFARAWCLWGSAGSLPFIFLLVTFLLPAARPTAATHLFGPFVRKQTLMPLTGEIAEDLARYLVDSEQTQSAMGLGVSIGKDLRCVVYTMQQPFVLSLVILCSDCLQQQLRVAHATHAQVSQCTCLDQAQRPAAPGSAVSPRNTCCIVDGAFPDDSLECVC